MAAFYEHQDDQVGPLLDEADVRNVAGLLAAATARQLADVPDGVERLRRVGLAVARGEVR
ncbi:hypothetical protein ACIRVK_13685 [Streptomyces sp. NPDC101152]|uniref:hypothetical protein n=1 Tax=Streptomyces sp. NPDC101152 TaxID=3366116 RepID=UPI00381205CB